MKISTLTIGIILMGAIVVGLYGFLGELASEDEGYNVDYDDSYVTTFDRVENMTVEISDKFEEVRNFSTKKSTAIQIITLVPDALGLLKDVLLLPFNITVSLISDLVTILGLPVWVNTFALGLLVSFLTYAFISAILRWKS